MGSLRACSAASVAAAHAIAASTTSHAATRAAAADVAFEPVSLQHRLWMCRRGRHIQSEVLYRVCETVWWHYRGLPLWDPWVPLLDC